MSGLESRVYGAVEPFEQQSDHRVQRMQPEPLPCVCFFNLVEGNLVLDELEDGT